MRHYLNTVDKYHRGYPDCDEIGYPANCREKSLYGDRALGVVEDDVLSGQVRTYDHSADMNAGHSGGPLYLYASNGWVQVFAVATGGTICFDPICTDPYPNYARNISLDMYNSMVSWISWHEYNNP